MTDLYSSPQRRFPAPSRQVTASPNIDAAVATVVLALRPDSSDEVLAQAIAAARRENAAVQAVVFATDTTTAQSTSSLDACTKLGAALAEAGLEYAVHRAGPDPAEQILGLADEHDAAVIVMSTKRRSPVVKLLLGSSAQQVILEAECPVLLVK